jgi:hypothetical protein
VKRFHIVPIQLMSAPTVATASIKTNGVTSAVAVRSVMNAGAGIVAVSKPGTIVPFEGSFLHARRVAQTIITINEIARRKPSGHGHTVCSIQPVEQQFEWCSLARRKRCWCCSTESCR